LAISLVRGQVPLASGTISIGPDDLPTAVSATLDVASIETQDADRDRDLRGADWFEVDKYPTMTFVARKIAGTPASFSVEGDLTFHGVTKAVTLAGKEEGKIVDGRGRTHVGYTASATIDRREWGLNWGRTTPGGELVVANDVKIDLNVEAVSK
jgi:polyisoprenoid-binding protein YceI